MSNSNGEKKIVFNGINGATGSYLFEPTTTKDLAAFIQAKEMPESQAMLRELGNKRNAAGPHFAPIFGVALEKIDETGWGFVISNDEDPAIEEALKELIDFRHGQAGPRFKKMVYRQGQDKNSFLAAFNIGPGPVDPEVAPYYLMIVGSPEKVPFLVQYELDVQFAVGRVHFNTPDEYARYARSVVDSEKGKVVLPRKAVFFGVENNDDVATTLSASSLVAPLVGEIQKRLKANSGWDIQTVLKEQATKSRLARLLGGDETPAFLFTASHGMGFPLNDPRLMPHQGAILCSDWPGPIEWRKPIPHDYYFAGEDLPDAAQLMGLISFHFACYGAGTPQRDDFSSGAAAQIAPHAFLADLPRRLLNRPRGGALAVVGHVERAWGYSFQWDNSIPQLTVFDSTIRKLLSGLPIGAALEDFNMRWAELATMVSNELRQIKSMGKVVDEMSLSGLWTANNDARSYIILGDPAVKLPVAAAGQTPPAQRPVIDVIVSQAPRTPPPPPGFPAAVEAASKTPTTSAPATAKAPEFSATVSIVEQTFRVTIPLEITVKLGQPGSVPIAPSPATVEAAPTEPVSFAINIDPDFSNREGYDPKFLGTGTQTVPLPKLTDAQKSQAARITGASGNSAIELKYNHFTIIINAARRLAFYTAVNIDGDLHTFRKELKRENDKWFFDPRIAPSAQVGEDLYSANPFDRGHLVRRLDPAWGSTLTIATKANNDTFHFSNCSPQHERFNQGKLLWAGLEDYLLNKASNDGKRITVFTGPVFRDSDPVHRGVKIPLEYWKVAVMARPSGKLAAVGFLVTQEQLVKSVSFGPAEVAKTFQTSIARIEQLTKLDFGKLRNADLGSTVNFAPDQPVQRELNELTDIVIPELPQTAPANGASPGDKAASFSVVTGTDDITPELSYFLLAYDSDAKEQTDHPKGLVSDLILKAAQDPSVTDIILLSHGWKGDVPEARAQYNAWIATVASHSAGIAAIKQRRDFRPLIVGLHWPSLPFGDESLAAPSFGSPGVLPAWAETFSVRLGNTPAIREAVERVAILAEGISAAPNRLPPDLSQAYRDLDRAVGLGQQGAAGAPGQEQDGFDPEAIFQDAQKLKTASFGLFDRDTLLSPLRQLSFWKMKDLGRTIGETAIHPFLVKLQQSTAGRNVRYHIMGHSFGCVVASATIVGPAGSNILPQPIDSLALLQGAVSHWAFCTDIPYLPGQAGYFHRLFTENRVRGPVITTQSKFDTAIGRMYPLGVRVAGQVAFAAGQPPKYGGIGAYGIQGPGPNIVESVMLPLDEQYSFQPGTVYNLESSHVIRNGGGFSGAHSDLNHPEVAHAILSSY